VRSREVMDIYDVAAPADRGFTISLCVGGSLLRAGVPGPLVSGAKSSFLVCSRQVKRLTSIVVPLRGRASTAGMTVRRIALRTKLASHATNM
jgi:hypothetical protein